MDFIKKFHAHPTLPPALVDFFLCLGSPSPIHAYLTSDMDILDYDLPLIFEKNRNLSVNQRIERDMPIIFNLFHFFEYDRHFDQHNEGGLCRRPVPRTSEDMGEPRLYLKTCCGVLCRACPKTRGSLGFI